MKTLDITYRYDGSEPDSRQPPGDAEAARLRLDAGSRTISALLNSETDGEARHVIHLDPRDLGLGQGAPAQRPYAAVLGCSDARVPVELIFNEGPNDLFVVRVAGNGLGGEVLGSLKYAVDHLGESLKLVVVLGHSGCGAVSAAVDVFLDPRSYLALATDHALRGILDRILVVIQAASKALSSAYGSDVTTRAGYRAALIESVCVTNAALAAHALQQHLGPVAEGLRAAYGVYLLETRAIWAPRDGSEECEGLAWAPGKVAAFDGFSASVVRSARIRSFLTGDSTP